MSIHNDIRSTSALLYADLATIIRSIRLCNQGCQMQDTHSYNNIENTQIALAVIT